MIDNPASPNSEQLTATLSTIQTEDVQTLLRHVEWQQAASRRASLLVEQGQLATKQAQLEAEERRLVAQHEVLIEAARQRGRMAQERLAQVLARQQAKTEEMTKLRLENSDVVA